MPSGVSIKTDINDIHLDLVINSNKRRSIKVTNTGNKEGEIKISKSGLDEMVVFDQESLVLAPGESKDVGILFLSYNQTGVYTGKLFIGDKEILVALDISSQELLFDVMIVVPDSNKRIKLGNTLESQVSLIPMGENPRLDVTANYIIKDFNGKIYSYESETFLIEGQKTFKKEFSTSSLIIGNYIVALELVYPNGVATSSSTFEVVTETSSKLKIVIKLLIFFVVILGLLVVFAMIRYKKHKTQKVGHIAKFPRYKLSSNLVEKD